ncbi:MAG TPA: carboxy-S-adenosyl-L-methionine synthase CmoA [Cellvibrionaceae bacterium]
MQSKTDTLFANPLTHLGEFCFDQAVVDVFPDMINRSVPGYATILRMIGQIAEDYARPNTVCYDLGCSLGAATLAMRHRINTSGTQIVAVDNSGAMVDAARQVIAADAGEVPVTIYHSDLQDVPIKNASVVVLNFTLQFIPVAQRQGILQRIADGLIPGGVLILSEKLAFDDAEHQELMTQLHHNFKRANGYSDLEIAQKRSALEHVLIPETYATHKQRLVSAGFRCTDLWFQCFNFASMLAFK